jgi:Asp-tRNA(Asn)/Glu-tRNA(Gln) amidotransferase A subunit family amidase
MHMVIGEEDMDVDGERIFHRKLLATFTSPINQIGVPAISAPIRGTGQPPVSVQLVGPMWGESCLLAVASSLETGGVFSVERPPNYFSK